MVVDAFKPKKLGGFPPSGWWEPIFDFSSILG